MLFHEVSEASLFVGKALKIPPPNNPGITKQLFIRFGAGLFKYASSLQQTKTTMVDTTPAAEDFTRWHSLVGVSIHSLYKIF